jgi:hypothetical protein
MTLIAIIIILAAMSLRFLTGAEAAAPEAQGTPVPVTIWNNNRITADTRSNAQELRNYSRSDIQITLVQGGTVNTTTVRLDRSNSGFAWATGATLLDASAISTTVVVSSNLIGRYGSIYADVSNSQPVTLTVISLNRP